MNNPLEQQADQIRKEWFPNHAAQFTRLGLDSQNTVQTLTWMNPGSGVYCCRYLIDRNVLAVHGDIGEAVYAWPRDWLTWEFLAGCDLDYFAGKCCASETGRGFRGWDQRRAQERLRELLSSDEELRKRYREVEDPCYARKGDWHHWLSRNGSEVFRDELCEVGDIGDCVHIRCHGHLLGIKMAVAQEGAIIHAMK
jgi:hypothetical protein